MRGRDFGFVIVLMLLFTILAWSAADVACAHGQYVSTAEFLDAEILGPRGSVLTGEVLIDNWRWYGVPVRTQLVILGAETSLGTRSTGGRLVDLNNFGCIRAFGDWKATKWGAWANGTVTIRGKAWLTWPTMEIGAHAWGRYMKVGVNGRYRSLVFNNHPDWQRFANIYYGASVPGIGHYVSNLRAIDSKFTGLARQHGFIW